MDHQKITCHMIFDVKMEDFRRKARFVAGGHKTEVPKTITYASVVSRETVRLALLLASLNDLEVKAADIMNAYITAPVTEKIWTVLGPEFGEDACKSAIIVRAIDGLKSAGAAFRAHLASAMRSMGYDSCRADPDLWMKKKTRPEDKFEYYSYVLCYVDGILCCDHDASEVMRELGGYFALKPGSVGSPNIYLGAKMSETTLENGVRAWGMSSSNYVQESVKNCKAHLAEHFKGRFRVLAKAENPFSCGYEPELDSTPELGPEEASDYQSVIGMLRWMIELGRIDIATKVSLLLSHLALPREGHMEVALHVMGYLDKKHNSRLVLDPSYPEISHDRFMECNWKEFCGDAHEAIPEDVLEPNG
ncbi:hypothetical protein ACHAWF_014099 [Thalassiosira exigua]